MGQHTAKKGDRGEGLRAGDPGAGAGEALPGEIRESGVCASSRPPPLDAARQGRAPCMSDADVRAQYRDLVWMLLLKARVPEDAAEDLFNKVFSTMSLHIAKQGVPRHPAALLAEMTRHAVLFYRRTVWRGSKVFDTRPDAGDEVAIPPSQANPEQLYSRREQWDLANAALAELPAEAARVLKVYYLEERADSEAAVMFACTEEQLRVRRHRALSALRDLMERLTRRRGGAR